MNLLSSRQKTLAAAALSVFAVAVLVGGVLGLIWVLTVLLDKLSGVLLPPAAAAILALVVKPYYGWLHRVTGKRAPLASALVLFSLAVPIGVFVGVFGSLLVRELVGLIGQIPEWIAGIRTTLQERWPDIAAFWEEHELTSRARTALDKQGSALARGVRAVGAGALSAGIGVFRSVAATLSWAVFPVYFFFFNMIPGPRPDQLDDHLSFLDARVRENVVYLAREFIHILVAFFRGQLVIALIQGGLFAFGFSVVGLSYGFVLGILLGVLNIIPYLGNMIGLLLCLPIAFFQPDGGWILLLAVLAVIALVQMVEGYFLTPRIMGRQTGLHPAAIIFALFFWGTVFEGVAGMVLAIPLTAFLVIFWRLIRREYLSNQRPAPAQ